MGDNNEQEAADLAAIHNDDDDNIVVVVRYLGGRLDNHYNNENPRPPGVQDYIIPADARIRLIIDASVTKIDRHACYNLRMLIEVVFHNHVTKIGRSAFMNCRNLERIELPAGLLRVERLVFQYCSSLRGEIVIPASVQYMGHHVFDGCRSLESAVFAPTTNVVELGRSMFRECSNLRLVTLPQDLRSIPVEYFRNCTSLSHLQIPESVQLIERVAFSGSAIQSMAITGTENDAMEIEPMTVLLPPKLRSISESCFMNCRAMTNIRIPVSMNDVGMDSFSGSGLRVIEIPKHVQQIRKGAFQNCAFLERITIHASTNLTMADNIFANCPLLSVIQLYQWLWPTLFASMNEHPEFIFRFIRHYHTQILDFETPDVRLFRQLRRRLQRDGLR